MKGKYEGLKNQEVSSLVQNAPLKKLKILLTCF